MIPDGIQPMLAKSSRHEMDLPTLQKLEDSGCVLEPKYDGVRCIAVAKAWGSGRTNVTLHSRAGGDMSASFPEVREAVARLVVVSGYSELTLDGEIVLESGDFSTLISRVQRNGRGAGTYSKIHPARYMVFDLVRRVKYDKDRDTKRMSLLARHEYLALMVKRLEAATVPARKDVGDVPAEVSLVPRLTPEEAYAVLQGDTYEGVMVKLNAASYTYGRSEAWMKVKPVHTASFLLIGFDDQKDAIHVALTTVAPGSAVPRLVDMGRVGSGMTASFRSQVEQFMARDTSQGTGRSPVIEIQFQSWNPQTNRMRFPVIKGLRADLYPTPEASYFNINLQMKGARIS